jgi:hypothetical protein
MLDKAVNNRVQAIFFLGFQFTRPASEAAREFIRRGRWLAR